MSKPRLAIDEHGVVHVNIQRRSAWPLCEAGQEESSRVVASVDRPTPTCLWCVVAFQRGHS